MRTAKIIGLKWKDIDFYDKTIKVEQSRRQGVETLPKTQNSIRTINIIDTLMPHLELHRMLVKDDSELTYIK